MLNPNILPNIAGNQTVSGEMSYDSIADLRKALTADYGSDVSTLTGGGALRIQSLERTMLSTIQENKHFALFNELAKTNATATVDEWTEQNSVGGFLGGSTNTETGTISASQGGYARRVGMVKYLMTRREVSFVVSLQNAIVEAEAVEQQNGALQLLTDAEYLSFEGDSTIVPTEFDGIKAQILAGVAAGQVDGGNVLDAAGASLASIDLVNKAASTIAGYGNFGTPTHIFMSQLTQSDFDTNLDPAFRVPLTDVGNGGVSLGSPVVGIRTSWGNIKTVADVFIRDERQQLPFQADPNTAINAIATANAGNKPATVTVAMTSDTASKFTAAQAGNYYWFVCGVNAAGQSTGTWTIQTAVAAGQKATLTITPASAGSTETGYVIYRGRLNAVGGTGNEADVRFMGRVARTGTGTTTTAFVDNNTSIPGTSNAYILNLSPGAQSITWRQMLPMLKFPLYPTVSATIPWAQLMFGYLRIGKRRHHVVIKNIVPAGAAWKPFN